MKIYGGESSNLPLKVNPAGVIPAIFASSLLLLPATITTFSGQTDAASSTIMSYIAAYMGRGQPLHMLFFGALIVFFLVVEPHGLARLWSIAKEKLRLWPFPH